MTQRNLTPSHHTVLLIKFFLTFKMSGSETVGGGHIATSQYGEETRNQTSVQLMSLDLLQLQMN